MVDYYPTLFMNGAFGAAAGAFPLVIGFKRGRYIVAVLSFVACVVGGMMLGRLLSFPMAFVTSAGIANLASRRKPRPRRDPWDEDDYASK